MNTLDIADRDSVKRFLKLAQDLWNGAATFHESDTVERLVVPVLEALGWNIDSIAPKSLVRGNRANSGHRLFDLNLYADNHLCVALECKAISQGYKSNDCTSSPKISDQSSSKQLLSYCTRDYGFETDFTIPVWTNGRLWVIYSVRSNIKEQMDVVRKECLEINHRRNLEIVKGGAFTAFRILRSRKAYDVDVAMSVLQELRSNIAPACFERSSS